MVTSKSGNKGRLLLFTLVSTVPFFVWNRFRVSIPFVDDWVLLNWLEKSNSKIEYLQLINGHQQLLIKIFLRIYTYFFDYNFRYIGFFGILLALGSAINFDSTFSRKHKRDLNYFLVAVFLAICTLNMRQFQNYFMIICLPWIFAIYAISLTIRFWQVKPKKFPNLYLIFLFITAFTNGLGLSFTFSFGLLNLIQIKKNTLKSIQVLATSLSAILLAYVLPTEFITEINAQNNLMHQISYTLTHLIQSIQFLLVLTGQLLVPWSLQFIWLSEFFGLIVIALIARYFIISRKKSDEIVFILTLTYVVFSINLILSRLESLGTAGALEPRYTTGSLLIYLALVATLYQSPMNPIRLATLAIASWMVISSGLISGAKYYQDRAMTQQNYKKCINTNSNVQTCTDYYFSLNLGVEKDNFETIIKKLTL